MTVSHDERALARQLAQVRKVRRTEAKQARPKNLKADRGRVRDTAHLAYLRRQPCACCGRPAPSDAAHIRMASLERGKVPTGMQVKPSDRFAVPLNRACHERQHSMSEARFWRSVGLDPFEIADRLYAAYSTPGDTP